MSRRDVLGGLVLAGVCLIAALMVFRRNRVAESRYEPVYGTGPSQPGGFVLGIHPLHNPQRLYATYAPIVEFLNRNLTDAVITLEASRSYEAFEGKLYQRHFHFALPNPYQTIEALRHGYHVFGKMGEDEKFRGLILVRKDSEITRVADLKGRTISFPAPTALAATMMPLYFLHSEGLDVKHDIQPLYAGSQESVIMNVYLGRAAAGATWPQPWEAFVEHNPKFAAELRVKWETPPLVNNSLVVRDDVPPALVARIGALLFALHTHEEGRRLLAELPLARFEAATDATYDPVRDFLVRYAAAMSP